MVFVSVSSALSVEDPEVVLIVSAISESVRDPFGRFRHTRHKRGHSFK